MTNELMAREIDTQADALWRCAETLSQTVASLSPPKGRILGGGCGDSAFAPAALGEVFGALGLDVQVRTSMTLVGFTRFEAGDTLVLTSISGETRRTVEAANVARAGGARVIALTCRADSSLARTAHETIILPITPLSRKTPHTLDYTQTLVALVQIALTWRGRAAGEVAPILQRAPQALATARETAAALAAPMSAEGKLFLLGAGAELATANYGAAKFHEAGGLIAIAAETENFIHGMNYMVDPGDSIIALGGNAPGLKRGREVVASFREFVANSALVVPESSADEGWGKSFETLLSTTFTLQHLCMAFADRQGLAVDQPRAGRANGAAHLAMQAKLFAS